MLHATAGVTLKQLGSVERTDPDDLPEDPIEFEVFEPAAAPEIPEGAAEPLMEASPIDEEVEEVEDAPPPQEEPPATLSPQNIVELPEAPEEAPDDPSYLAERDMRADEQTIARTVGEATNREEGGVTDEPEPQTIEESTEPEAEAEDLDAPLDDAPGEPEESQDTAETPAAEEIPPVDDAPETVPDTPGTMEESDIALSDRGEVPIQTGRQDRESGPTEVPDMQEPSPASPGGGRRSLMPSRDQLARAVEPAQRNLIEEQRGDVTLLNAQSSEMAAYIIERAKRIYSYLNINAPMTTIYYDDVADMRLPITLEARIERDGTVAHIETIRSSGSPKIDRLVTDAMRSGLHGRPLPPEEAFSDSGRPMRFRFALHSDHIEAGTP